MVCGVWGVGCGVWGADCGVCGVCVCVCCVDGIHTKIRFCLYVSLGAFHVLWKYLGCAGSVWRVCFGCVAGVLWDVFGVCCRSVSRAHVCVFMFVNVYIFG